MLIRKLLLLSLLIGIACENSVDAQQSNLNFFSFSRTDGLSNNDVTAIVKDHSGYIWIGTANGLNRYNGYQFKNYYYNAADLSTVCGNHVNYLEVDRAGRLWIAFSTNGVAWYDRISDSFKRFSLITNVEATASDQVRQVKADHHNVLWAATADGLFYFDSLENQFGRIQKAGDFPVDYTGFKVVNELLVLTDDIQAIAPCETGGLWVVYADMRISYLDMDMGYSKHIAMPPDLADNAGHAIINEMLFHDGVLYIGTTRNGLISYDTVSLVSKILLDRQTLSTATGLFVHDGELWITGFNGLIRYDMADGDFVIYNTRPGDPKSLRSAANHTVFIDDQDILWLGTINSGVNYANINLPFNQLFEDQLDISMLSQSRVNAVFHDRNGNIWVGYQSGGIDLFSAEYMTRNPVGAQALRGDGGVGAIFQFFESKLGDIYMVSWLGGLQKYNRNMNRFETVIRSYDFLIRTMHGLDIRAVDEDASGNLWLAVHGEGVVKYNDRSKVSRLFAANAADLHMLSNKYVFDLRFDQDENLWVATPWGANRLAPGDTLFRRYFATGDAGSILGNQINFLYKDTHNRMWFSTYDGLSLYNPETDAFFTIRLRDYGLDHLLVKGMIMDAEGDLWLSSSGGIIHFVMSDEGHSFNPVVVDHFVYDINHGILSEDFFFRATSKDRGGRLFFGGTSGIDYFDPAEFHGAGVLSLIQIEEVRLFNRVIHPGSPSGPSLNATGEALFHHRENMFGFSFVSLSYTNFQRKSYFYRLHPLHDSWHNARQNRDVTFANLAPGQYVFMVKYCTQAEGCDEQTASFAFVIKAPFWKTSLFRVLVVMAMISSLILMHLAWSARQRNRQYTLERLVRSRTNEIAQKNEELNQINTLKNKLLSVLGHDLRSPVATMVSLIELLQLEYDRFDDKKRKHIISNLDQTAERYLMLVDNLLQWSGSQAGRISVKMDEVNLYGLVESTQTLLRSGFEGKGVSFDNKVQKELTIASDAGLIGIILRNLIFNALKFTPSGGAIQVAAKIHQNNMIRIDVADTGVGIKPEQAARIFSTGLVAQSAGTEGEGGTGLGLMLCKDFTEKLGGKIWIEETSPRGTTFSFTLPSSKSL